MTGSSRSSDRPATPYPTHGIPKDTLLATQSAPECAAGTTGFPLTMKAVWNDTVVAESDATIVVEGNHYFPTESVNWEALTPSSTTTRCFWKGKASYYDVTIGDRTNPDAAWTYEKPWAPARHIAGHVAFWHGVRVQQ